MTKKLTLLAIFILLAGGVQADPVVLTSVMPHGHKGLVIHTAFVQGDYLITATNSGEITLWSISNYHPQNKKTVTIEHKKLKVVAYASDAKGRYLAVGFYNGLIKIIDLLLLQNDSPNFEVGELMSGVGLKSLAFNFEGTYLASWSPLEMFWWDMLGRTVMQNTAVSESEINENMFASLDNGMASMTFKPDNSLLVSSHLGVQVHDFKGGAWQEGRNTDQIENSQALSSLSGRVAFFPDGKAIVVVTTTLNVYAYLRSSL
jgi:WD40 repeat protein